LTGRLHFTPPQGVWIAPGVRQAFRGKIVLLTGPDTVSASETFTMALMSRESHIVRVGLNTQGVFSDVLGRHLPNGWRFHLPNEIYLTEDEKAFDGVGIPPEVRIFFSHLKT
jgi:C-terminal processing protease CtpA/Prc